MDKVKIKSSDFDSIYEFGIELIENGWYVSKPISLKWDWAKFKYFYEASLIKN